MIEAIETLLLAWGAELLSPLLDVSIRSPLGAMGDDAPPGGTGGSRCLSSVECAVALTRATEAVNTALHNMALDEPEGLAARGRVLARLAVLRYCQPLKLTIALQCRALGYSQRTYRTRVDELHRELALALPGVIAVAASAARVGPAVDAAKARAARAREAERDSRKRLKRLLTAGKAYGRALRASGACGEP